MGDLDGRHIVITGGTGALGSGVTALLLERGARCHVSCLHESERKRLPWASHDRVRIVSPVDLTDEAHVARLFDTGDEPLRRVPMMEPARGTAAHVASLIDASATSAELLDRLGS